MMQLTFIEVTHQYILDGLELPSVTTVIGGAFNMYKDVSPELLKRAGDFGRAVHRMCELELNNSLDDDFLDSALAPYLAGFKGALSTLPVNNSYTIEKPMCCPSLRFAGTPDIFIEPSTVSKGRIIDIKTRPYNATTDPLQLAAYDRLCGGDGGSYDHYVLEIMPNDFKFVKCNHPQAWGVFKELLDYHHRTKEIQTMMEGWKSR